MEAENTHKVFDWLWSSGQLSEKDIASLPALGIDAVINLALPTSSNALPGEAESVTRQGIAYFQIPVEWERPELHQLVQFFGILKAFEGHKVWVHCAKNMRVSAFIYLYRKLCLAESEEASVHPMQEVWVPNETWQAFIRNALSMRSNHVFERGAPLLARPSISTLGVRLRNMEHEKMKQKLIILLAFLAVFRPATSFADNEVSFGIGAGALYSGIGVNTALRGDNHLGYVAAGCIGIGYSGNSGWALPCGIGAGWIWTDLLTKASNRHGLGLYAGPIGFKDGGKARYGLGVTYVYFLQGVNNKGWNFGVTPATGQENGKAKGSLLINAGYQF